jgi:two-component system cell cycle sensor histidine kinase/response regulator CckA
MIDCSNCLSETGAEDHPTVRSGPFPFRRFMAAMQTDRSSSPIDPGSSAPEDLLRLQVSALEAAANPIVISRRDGTIIWVNKAFEQLSGYSRDEAIGQTTRLLKSGLLPTSFYRTMWDTILSGQQWRGELINRRKDGTFYHEEMTITPVKSHSGEITHFIAIKLDITERKQLEQQLLASQKMEAVGRLAGGVAHDFNNLLQVIMGYSDLVVEAFSPPDPRSYQLQQIKKAGLKATALTRQLLAFSRKQVFQPRVLDVNALITDFHKMLHRIVGEDIELETHLKLEPGNIKADPGQVEQIIMNLVVNSRDAMPEGGKLSIETANVDLDEAYCRSHPAIRPGRYVMIAITDTGIGMDSQTQARIFEPFFTTKEQGKGTGLGLATVYGIVKQSEGFIWVYSELAKGTTFKLYFPRIDAPAQIGDSHEIRAEIVGGSETILLVEDSEPLRELTRAFLEKNGYSVLAADSGTSALALAERQERPIRLLLTDVVMPGMSGRDLADRLAARYPALKVLYMSGYTSDAIVKHGVLQPGISFIEKPFSERALMAKLREVLDHPANP